MIYQEIQQEIRQEALQEGVQQGRQEEGATLVLRLLARRVDQITPEVRSPLGLRRSPTASLR